MNNRKPINKRGKRSRNMSIQVVPESKTISAGIQDKDGKDIRKNNPKFGQNRIIIHGNPTK